MSASKPRKEAEPRPGVQEVLRYLQHRLPAYPYDDALDREFVDELVSDFPQIEILEEVKAFRWYYNNAPGERMRHIRLGLRRWLANARTPRRARA